MRYLYLLLVLMLTGCASVPMSDYIGKADHPYDRKIYASLEKVTSAFIYVLKKQGWTISEADPSVYERDDRYDNNGYRNLLIITDIRKKSLHLTSTHLNVFIHSIDNTCDVEIRYEGQTTLIKRFNSSRSDALVQSIWDAVQQEINS